MTTGVSGAEKRSQNEAKTGQDDGCLRAVWIGERVVFAGDFGVRRGLRPRTADGGKLQNEATVKVTRIQPNPSDETSCRRAIFASERGSVAGESGRALRKTLKRNGCSVFPFFILGGWTAIVHAGVVDWEKNDE